VSGVGSMQLTTSNTQLQWAMRCYQARPRRCSTARATLRRGAAAAPSAVAARSGIGTPGRAHCSTNALRTRASARTHWRNVHGAAQLCA
jgi:hypothetical protein